MADAADWTLIVHGGCKPIAPSEAEANRKGLRKALAAAVARLSAGRSALDAVEAAIRVLEDDPTFNAGCGSAPNAAGAVEMDAAIMDGETLKLGGVCALSGVSNPIRVARGVLAEGPTLLAGDGALEFARSRGLAGGRDSPARAGEGSAADTVGCVALDSHGRIAAGTSTGGLEGAPVGRVGDSPLPGCGLYADNASGGVSATGMGEAISRSLLGARVIFALEAGEHPQAAVEAALTQLNRVGGDAGLIALDRLGRIGWSHRGDQFAVAWASAHDPSPKVEIADLPSPAEASHG